MECSCCQLVFDSIRLTCHTLGQATASPLRRQVMDVPASSASSRQEKNGTTSQKSTRASSALELFVSRNILLCLLAFRVLNALTIKTFFQPDEYFQSLEPAWAMVFGDASGAWITWVNNPPNPQNTACLRFQEWRHRLRSAIHPALFAGVYQITSVLAHPSLLSPSFRAELFVAVPKIMQAVFAAVGDYFTWRLAERIYGRQSQVASAAVRSTHKQEHGKAMCVHEILDLS